MDLHTILHDHKSRIRPRRGKLDGASHKAGPSTSEIPDLFFDEILVEYKLSRIEIMILMFLYRRVWCKPNLYKTYGISPLLSHKEIENSLKLNIDEIYHALRKLEDLGFISTIRSGQYFVRKYFTKENDESFHQTYDDFEVL